MSNIYEQYGIKEVADVTLYAIDLDENDDEIYIPVLYLDTLKISSIEETASSVSARGGIGNPELITWDFGKEITVNIEDALYTPASQSMTWGGKYATKKLSLIGNYVPLEYPEDEDGNPDYTETPTEGTPIAAKCSINNLKDFVITPFNGANVIYNWTGDCSIVSNDGTIRKVKDSVVVKYSTFLRSYSIYNNSSSTTEGLFFYITVEDEQVAIAKFVLSSTGNNVPPQETIYSIDHALQNVKFLERMEECVATKTFVIQTDNNLAHGNYRYIPKYSECELTVFIDPNTMQPYEPNATNYTKADGTEITNTNLRIIKQNEVYLKWTRTKALDNTSLGRKIVIDSEHFSGAYKLVGETYSRAREGWKDERFQFEIPLCKMSTENSLALQAEGEPTTFSMSLKVLRPDDGEMMKFTQYKVDKQKYDGITSGSTKVIMENEVLPSDPSSGSD